MQEVVLCGRVKTTIVTLAVTLCVGHFTLGRASGAQEDAGSTTEGTLSAAELAKQIHNPIGNLREVIIQLDVLPNVGPGRPGARIISLQPVWPFNIGTDWKLITYSIVPYVSQPGMALGEDRVRGLGDTTFYGYFARAEEGNVIWGIGPALQLPTATDEALGSKKWSAGPALVLGVQPGNWSIFGLFDNVWSVAGSGDQEVNEFNFQYQAVYQFPKRWFFITNWVVEADWEAERDDRWTVPIGGGAGRQFKIGNQQFQAYGQVGYDVVKPDNASGWRAIAVLALVF